MIRLLVRFGKWLEARFPEKLVVTAANYNELAKSLSESRVEIDLLRSKLQDLDANHAATIDRVGRIEASAVHKGAVQELVVVVKDLKDEIVALKANLGWSKGIVADAGTPDKLAAFLNGDIVHAE